MQISFGQPAAVVRPGRSQRGSDGGAARNRVLPDESLNEAVPGLDTERQTLLEDPGPGPEQSMASIETGAQRSALLALLLMAPPAGSDGQGSE